MPTAAAPEPHLCAETPRTPHPERGTMTSSRLAPALSLDDVPTEIPARRGSIDAVVVGSTLLAALLAGVSTLILAGGSSEPVVTGLALLSFAAGWGALRILSARRTHQPQAWATVPAAVLGLSGLAFLVLRPSEAVLTTLAWWWPPVLAATTVWTASRVRASLRSWTRSFVVYPVLVLQLLVATGGQIEAIRNTRDAEPVGEGSLYDVGDHRLYLDCQGTGSPTVVLEAGMSSHSASMGRWLAPEVARHTRVCVYDRAGYGSSEPDPGTRRPDDVTTDLHALLRAADVPAPYVLAGHSSGAIYVRMFAEAYPGEVAGLALLDGQPAEAMTDLPSYPLFYDVYRRVEALMPTLARFGVMRLVGGEGSRHYRTLHDEIAVLPDRLDLARDAGSLGSTPLAVVTAAEGAQDGWMPLQEAMSRLSTDNVHMTLTNATHTDVVDDEVAAGHAARALLAVVEAVRTGRRVALR